MSTHTPLPVYLGIFLSLFQFNQHVLGQDNLSLRLDHRIDHAFSLVDGAADSAIKIASEVYVVAKKEGIPKLVADALYIKGLAYWYQGKAGLSLVAHREALAIREEIGDSIGIGRSFNNIGLIAQHAGQDSFALSFFQKSFRIRKQMGEEIELLYSATNICDQLDRLGQHDSAAVLRQQVTVWAENSNNSAAQAFVIEHLGLMEEKRGNYHPALTHYQRAYKLREGEANQRAKTRGLLQQSRCMAILDSISPVVPIEFATEAMSLARYHDWDNLESQAHHQLSNLYAIQGDVDSAYLHLFLHKNIQDRISEGETLLYTQALTAIYDEFLRTEQQSSKDQQLKNSFLRRWIEWLGALLFMGILLGIIFYISYKRIKSQRNRLNIEKKQIEEKNLKLKFFSSIVSHDIKEPLRSFTYFLELLDRHGLTTPGSELEEEYTEAKKRIVDLSSMLEDLEIYFGLTEGVMKWHVLDLNVVANKVFSDLKPKIRQTRAQINVGTLPVIETQPTLIYQILLNLTSNALRFQRQGETPVVTIEGYTKGNSFYLSVKDNGIGIPAEYIDGIFKAFNRGSYHEFPGSGLGLAIVAKAISLLEGTVKVESQPGNGSTFTVILPVVSQQKVQEIEVINPQSISA